MDDAVKVEKVRRQTRKEIRDRPCPLCLQGGLEKIKSHIVPGLVFEPLLRQKADGNRDTVIVKRDPNNPGHATEERGGRGFREPLLCAICDNTVIGDRYENYAKKWFDAFPGLEKTTKRELGHEYPFDVDYTKFKLFALSIAWRAAITELPEFANCKIYTPSDLEKLRAMVHSGDAGGDKDFWFFVERQLVPSRRYAQEPVNLCGYSFLLFFFPGWVLWFPTSQTLATGEGTSHPSLLQSGEVVVKYVDDSAIAAKTLRELKQAVFDKNVADATARLEQIKQATETARPATADALSRNSHRRETGESGLRTRAGRRCDFKRTPVDTPFSGCSSG